MNFKLVSVSPYCYKGYIFYMQIFHFSHITTVSASGSYVVRGLGRFGDVGYYITPLGKFCSFGFL